MCRQFRISQHISCPLLGNVAPYGRPQIGNVPIHFTEPSVHFMGYSIDYTLYTNYTDYTPYTRYTANPEKSTGIEIPACLIRRIYKRTQPMLQAQPCIPAECGG